jgi:hypothetical protein
LMQMGHIPLRGAWSLALRAVPVVEWKFSLYQGISKSLL